MIIAFIQAIFTCIFYFVTIPIYNGYLQLGYSTIYTMMPVFSLVLDKDVSLEKVTEFPALYITLQKGRALNFKTFMIWTWKSIFQAALIMLVAITQFNESFTNIVSITFTTLILIELLNIVTEVWPRVKKTMVLTMLITLIIYIASIVIFRSYFEVSYIDWQFIAKVSILTLLCWLPLHLLKMILVRCDPNQEQKIMKGAS